MKGKRPGALRNASPTSREVLDAYLKHISKTKKPGTVEVHSRGCPACFARSIRFSPCTRWRLFALPFYPGDRTAAFGDPAEVLVYFEENQHPNLINRGYLFGVGRTCGSRWLFLSEPLSVPALIYGPRVAVYPK